MKYDTKPGCERRPDTGPEPETDLDSRIHGSMAAAAFSSGTMLRSVESRRRQRRLGQFATSLSLVALLYGLVALFPRLPTPTGPTHGFADTTKLRPTAFTAEEIFLPRALIAKAEDKDLRGILRDQDVDRLDAFLEANGLKDAWFLVRYRGLTADGSTWRGRDSNFECKRYQVHSASMKEAENRFRNLQVLSRALTRTAGEEPETIMADGQAKDPTVTIFHFNEARIVPIPDGATGLRWINQRDIDVWRSQAVPGSP